MWHIPLYQSLTFAAHFLKVEYNLSPIVREAFKAHFFMIEL